MAPVAVKEPVIQTREVETIVIIVRLHPEDQVDRKLKKKKYISMINQSFL
jgi:hypothetical protein